MYEQIQAAKPLLNSVSRLSLAQAGLILLRSCAGFPRMAFLARTTTPDTLLTTYQQFDREVREAAERLIQVKFPPPAWHQASLPIHLGGLGLSSLQLLAPACFAVQVDQWRIRVEGTQWSRLSVP